ncbi:beta-ketoacyl synthase N-terminal-like domain-containing protein [Streptomyces sp. MZ04]|uniref:beta-ketoacyl synthase N-terminal-like domain-containing protein n=1 Tax=Streptomyces sp. MZ04 TaxID=2559236 RepID=UPI00107EA363|nr:beta-ketoacyl synthase N-terminal-like domain-containing protein [Streptomyces sp. MZ04]TGB15129.1 beta-ketoacyl synthase [Streptomyces sp. MZ04]
MDATVEIREADVAVVGMACRFPGAENVGQFWQNLCAGTRTTTYFTGQELLAAGVAPELLADPRYVKAGQVLADSDMFDADLFRIPRDEAEVLDPQQRVFLECALTALEDAGCDPDRCLDTVGVYAGAGLNAYAWHYLADRFRTASDVERYRLMIASDKDFLATRVSYKLGLRGPSVNVGTACSTSLVAVHLACLALLGGECDTALAGSAHIRIPQDQGYLYQEGMIFSPDGRCRAFDAKAQGTVLGSGVGVVVLKRLSDALAAGDLIHAVIKGSAINNDGSLKASYTAPSIDGQAAVISDALRVAECPPETITYVEAHGTGTALGDPVEVAALNAAFAPAGPDHACALGSVKSAIGHLDTASGMAGLIKTVLMLRHGRLVPAADFESPNPQIPFAEGPFSVHTELCDWQTAGHGPRRAGVSSFGIGGTNAHVVLEEPPARPAAPAVFEGPALLLVSAATAPAADRAAATLARHLRRAPATPLHDVAGTLALGRRVHAHRRFVVADGVRDAAMALAVGSRDRVAAAEVVRESGSAAFLCTGLSPDGGAHAVALYEQLPAFRAAVNNACTGLVGDEDDARKALTTGDAVAAALAEYATAQVWSCWGVRPAGLLATGEGWRAAGCLAGLFDVAFMLDPGQAGPPATASAEPLWLADGDGWRGPGSPVSAADGSDPASMATAVRDSGLIPVRMAPDYGSVHDPGMSGLLASLGQAWLAGLTVDWSRVHSGRPFRRVGLPTYPFQRERFWYDPESCGAHPQNGPSLGEIVGGRWGAEQEDLLTQYLQAEIGKALGPQPTESGLPDPAVNLFDLNAESLMLIELTAKLSDELRCEIPATAFIDYPTIEEFVRNFAETLGQ